MPRYSRRRNYSPEYGTRHRNVNPDGPEDHVVKHFTSCWEFAEWAESALAERGPANAHYYDGYASSSLPRVRDGISTLRQGDERNLDQAKAYLDQLNLSVPAAKLQWTPAITGVRPNVPAYLAGIPQSMQRRVHVRTDRSPLRVWVGLTSSSGVSEDQLRQRGCVLSAFAMAMRQIRPVYVVPYVNMGWWKKDTRALYDGVHSAVISWDIRTSPLVLSELLGVCSKPEVTRYLGITACNLLNPATNGHCNPILADEPDMRQLLGIRDNDLYLGQIHLYDPMLTNPVGWLREQVERYSQDK